MIGVIATGDIAVGLVQANELVPPMRVYPKAGEAGTDAGGLHSMPMDAVVDTIARMIRDLCAEHGVRPAGVGIGIPGIIRGGVIEESPNLKQGKGARLAEMAASALMGLDLPVPVSIFNDADVMAAGIAASRGQLERLVRVWTLGHGIGFGRYPHAEGVWEGGHIVVSLDPKEAYCGCGGRGHLEGIMGRRAMRLRFLDLEPEEIFANARDNDARCAEFVRLWHRALGAATASTIHMQGPGKFYLSGSSARFVQFNLLSQYLPEMVTMSSLQGSVFEIVPMNKELSIVGAAVNAARAAWR